ASCHTFEKEPSSEALHKPILLNALANSKGLMWTKSKNKAAISRSLPSFLSISAQQISPNEPRRVGLVDGDVDVAPVIGRDQALSVEDDALHIGLEDEGVGRLVQGQPGDVVDQLLLSSVVGLVASRAMGQGIGLHQLLLPLLLDEGSGGAV